MQTLGSIFLWINSKWLIWITYYIIHYSIYWYNKTISLDVFGKESLSQPQSYHYCSSWKWQTGPISADQLSSLTDQRLFRLIVLMNLTNLPICLKNWSEVGEMDPWRAEGESQQCIHNALQLCIWCKKIHPWLRKTAVAYTVLKLKKTSLSDSFSVLVNKII